LVKIFKIMVSVTLWVSGNKPEPTAKHGSGKIQFLRPLVYRREVQFKLSLRQIARAKISAQVGPSLLFVSINMLWFSTLLRIITTPFRPRP
jgi:hypothetical protein